jgi:hypothetical protein
MTSYPVLERARTITRLSDLDILEIRKFLGVPLASDIINWLGAQAPHHQLCLDFAGVRAITASVAEELGPLLLQTVQQSNRLEHRYPVYGLYNQEHAYTFATALADSSLAAIAIVDPPVEPSTRLLKVLEQGEHAVVVLGHLSKQMEQILLLADRRALLNQPLTSEHLTELDFMAEVSPAARSKRLTELYARRLLAFEENPRNPKERLFTPVWRLPDHEHSQPA